MSPRTWLRRAVCGGVAAAGLTTSLLSARPASADPTLFADGGIRVGYTWGEGGGFTWGLDARLGSLFGDDSDVWCSGGTIPLVAGALRFEAIGLGRPRLGLGFQAGAAYGPLASVADVGLGYRWGEGGGVSVPVGFDLQILAMDSFVTFDAVRDNGFVGGGFHLPLPYDQFGCVSAGRALHDEHGRAGLPVVRSLSPVPCGSELESAVVGEWAERARAEWASVPAFLQLADQLGRAGAPRPLVERALRAAEDELGHAVVSARVAVRATGSAMALGQVTPAVRAPAQSLAALVRLAEESWVDGCLGEGCAAATAARESEVARAAGLRAMQATIATDEAGHAALAWDVLAWAIARGGDDVRQAVSVLRDVEPPGAGSPDDGPDLSAFGVLPAREQRRIRDAAESAARTRLDSTLAA